MSTSQYQSNLNSHGVAGATTHATKAAALKSAKDIARAHPGQLAVFYGKTWKPGFDPTEETRLFRADERGKVTEVL